MLRLLAIAAIVLGASIAWAVLGATLLSRTDASDTAQRGAISSSWGPPQEQHAPHLTLERPKPLIDGHKRAPGDAYERADVSPSRSRIDVALDLTQRQKGLLWYNTYTSAFHATYRFRNDGPAGNATIVMPFPVEKTDGSSGVVYDRSARRATYEDVTFLVDGRAVPETTSEGTITANLPLAAGQTTDVTVRYTTNGLATWDYVFGADVEAVHDFVLAMHTNFEAIDFPGQTLAPSEKTRTQEGWNLTWTYHELVAGYGIGMLFPERLQPGPLAERITFWAPLSLAFYVFVMLVITTLRRIDLHPINYFFLAAAFFAFHLLFAYLIDRISIELAFFICTLVSLGLTISYLRLVAGLRFAAVEAGLAQLFYQILFSLALFNEGSSGLSITVGAIVTLFVMMQLTGRIAWSERFPGRIAPSTPAGGYPGP